MRSESQNVIRRIRYPLPDVVNPAESVCITVQVPNDIGYIAAFWGQLFALTRWYAWAADVAHTAKEVAKVWEGVYTLAQESECENVLVRTSPVNDCLLQVSYDGGGLWETVYNAYGCALKAAADEFGSGSSQPASKSQPGEQPGGANPAPNQCFDVDATIYGNSMFLIPVAVASGWKIKLSQVKGAWWDGNIANYWQCPDGHQFALGTCTSNQLAGQTGDPLTTVNHMRLILRLADGTYADIPHDGTEYTVPAGQPAGNYFLLPNDGFLSDNQGSVAAHIVACSPGWCYEFNHLTGLADWIPGLENGVGSTGTHWDSSTGWVGDCYSYGSDWYGAAQVHKALPAGNYTRYEVDYIGQVGSYSFGNNNTYGYHNGNYINPGAMQTPPATLVQGGLNLGAGNFAVSIGYSNSQGNNNNCNTGNATIRAIRLYGNGSNPFGDSNC